MTAAKLNGTGAGVKQSIALRQAASFLLVRATQNVIHRIQSHSFS